LRHFISFDPFQGNHQQYSGIPSALFVLMQPAPRKEKDVMYNIVETRSKFQISAQVKPRVRVGSVAEPHQRKGAHRLWLVALR
jgi:hypothetical protein